MVTTIEDATEGSSEGTPKGVPWGLYKDARQGAFGGWNKGALSCLRQFWTTETPLKMIKKYFLFHLKALFFLKTFKFFSWLFSHVAKRLDKKDKINFRFYDVAA